MKLPWGAALVCVSITACGVIPTDKPAASTATRASLDVPQTLAAWRALAHPPARTVVVRREREGGFDFGPVADRLGLFALPLIPVGIVLGPSPTRFQRATVASPDGLERVGDFDADERLFRAWIVDADTVRVIQRFDLPSLHRSYLFDAGHAPWLRDGGTGRVTRTPLLPQGDVAAAAAHAMDHPEVPHSDASSEAEAWRSRVAAEVMELLGEESVALVRAWVRDRAVSDEGLAAVVWRICRQPFRWHGDHLRNDESVARATLAALGHARARVAASAEDCVLVASHRAEGRAR